jgi:hypothetical protein
MSVNPYESPIVAEERFDTAEAKIVAGAANSALTKRRILYSILAPLGLTALVLTMFWRTAQPAALLWLFVGYVAATTYERLGYGLAVLLYKSVIRKLLARVRELESRLAPSDDLP